VSQIEQSTDKLSARLQDLEELARHASLLDRLRLERTIAIIQRAQLTIQRTYQTEQRAWERMTQAKATAQRLRVNGYGRLDRLWIIQKDIPK
jgi:hypothetical protein